ncbi:MAG: hypothetical protein ACTSP4_15255, partial [Candidatus Hodarchaeales archaeon]
MAYLAAEKDNEEESRESRETERVLLVVIGGLLAGVVLLQVILPLRGYDATWMYFTSAYVMYVTDSIPLVNYLIMQPMFKEPVLLMMYTVGIYLTSDFSLIFLPVVFTFGNAALVYLLAKMFTENRRMQLYAVVIYLVMPLTKWMVEYWAYYQD